VDYRAPLQDVHFAKRLTEIAMSTNGQALLQGCHINPNVLDNWNTKLNESSLLTLSIWFLVFVVALRLTVIWAKMGESRNDKSDATKSLLTRTISHAKNWRSKFKVEKNPSLSWTFMLKRKEGSLYNEQERNPRRVLQDPRLCVTKCEFMIRELWQLADEQRDQYTWKQCLGNNTFGIGGACLLHYWTCPLSRQHHHHLIISVLYDVMTRRRLVLEYVHSAVSMSDSVSIAATFKCPTRSMLY